MGTRLSADKNEERLLLITGRISSDGDSRSSLVSVNVRFCRWSRERPRSDGERSLLSVGGESRAHGLAAFLNGARLSTPVSQRVWARVGCVRAASSEGGVNTQRPQRSEDERC